MDKQKEKNNNYSNLTSERAHSQHAFVFVSFITKNTTRFMSFQTILLQHHI